MLRAQLISRNQVRAGLQLGYKARQACPQPKNARNTRQTGKRVGLEVSAGVPTAQLQ